MSDPIVIDPRHTASASVIWLHGLGASASDFVDLPQQLAGGAHSLRFVLPDAPSRPVTVNDGASMPAWYDIYDIDIAAHQDADGLEASRQLIDTLIDTEIRRGMAAERIVLGGFSQGGALALHAGLRHRRKLAGIVILSAYLPLHERFDDDAASANARTEVFMAHGQYDPVVPIELASRSRDFLEARDYPVAWHDHPMQHEVCGAEIDALGAWLDRLL